MNTQAERAKFNADTRKRLSVCGLVLGACVLGPAVVTTGGASLNTFAIGAIVLALLGCAAYYALEIPLIAVVRFAFIASFFFKGDLSLYKIDEIEDPSGLNLSLTLACGLILFAYDYFFAEERERVFPFAFTLLSIALFVCAAISVIYAGPTLLGGFSLLSFTTSMLVAYVTALHFSRRERMIELVLGIAVGLLFTGLVALTQYTLDFPTNLASFGTGTEEELFGTQSQLLSRVPAFMRTPTEMAWVVSSLVPVVFAPVICRVKSLTPSQKAVLLISGLAGIVAIILSLARGSWLGFLTAMGLLVLTGWYKVSAHEKKKYFISVFGAIVLAVALLSPFSGRIFDRLTQDDEGSAQIRVPLMETAVRMINDNPIVGVGLNGYRSYMTKYDETGIFVSQVFPNPVHNVFAHITAEVGIPGGVLFCLLIVVAVYECFKTFGMSDRLLAALALGLGLGMIAFVISGTKEPGSLGSGRPAVRTCFFMFGSILALSRIRRRLLP
jgi:O-antigen ligase